MTSRERVRAAINHIEPDRIPMDLGATTVTGMAAGTMSKLRKALGLKEELVKVEAPFQILGKVEEDLRRTVQADVVGIFPKKTFLGFENSGWRPWKLQDGTDVLISKDMKYIYDTNGDILVYPQGNDSVRPSMRLPKGGFYFDTIVRQEEVDEENENGREDFREDYKVMSEEDLRFLEESTDNYYKNTDYALLGVFGGAGFGDASVIPGPAMLHTPGVRRLDEWMMWHLLNPEYIKDVYAYQTEICLKNLELYYQAVGDKIDVIYMSGTDYGTQRSEFMSRDLFREFYKDNMKKVNDWVHTHTKWKTFYHRCGSIVNFLDDFAEAGVDILNPVQVSAAGMDAVMLKEKYGDKFTFWGGAVDTQQVLPFGTPEEVIAQTQERLEIFSKGGGFVCSAIHNIQPNTPVENICAFYDTIHKCNRRKEQ